jgi:hypothetical protein
MPIDPRTEKEIQSQAAEEKALISALEGETEKRPIPEEQS